MNDYSGDERMRAYLLGDESAMSEYFAYLDREANMVTQQELDALRALANSAPPTPYRADGKMVYYGTTSGHDDFLVVCECWSSAIDARYIAAACNAVPALVDTVERLMARVAELERQAAYWRARYEHNTEDAYNARITEALRNMEGRPNTW